jgi:hypothetical protein
MKTQIFKIQSKGIKNETSGAFLPETSFKTKKGQYNKRFINYLTKIQPSQLNQVASKFNISSDELFNLIPQDKRQFVLNPENNKFYKPDWIKSRIDKNQFVIENNQIKPQTQDYVAKFREQLTKLNQSKINRIKVDLNKITLSNAITIAKQYLQSGQPVVKIVDSQGNTQIYTLSEDFVKRVKKTQNTGILDAFKPNQKKISDQELVKSATTNKIVYIEMIKKIKNQKPVGNFFPYWNLTDIDLSRYDIYQEKQKEQLNQDNCFYVALKNLKLQEDKLNQLKFLISNGTVPLSKINEICDKLKIRIELNQHRLNTETPKIFKYGTEGEIFNLCLYMEHYFINENVPFTTYSAKHYQEIKHINNYNTIIKIKNDKYEKSSNEKYHINSYNLIKILFQNKSNFQPMDFDTLIDCGEVDIDTFEFTSLEYSKENHTSCRLIEYKPKEKKTDYYKVFFDLETFADKEQEGKHIPYIVGYSTMDNKSGYFSGNDCVKQFLNFLVKLSKQVDNNNQKLNFLLIAHNAKYDNSFILKYVNIKTSGLIYKDGSFYSMEATYNGVNIKVVDSFKKISMPLKSFGKSFNLTQEKELMPYELYNEVNPILNPVRKLEDCLKYVDKQSEKIFIDNCSKFGCIENTQSVKYIDIIKYSAKYCVIDCEVLKQGYEKFNQMCKDAFDINADDFLTISSMADHIINKTGCYEGVYELSGIPRAFIQRCVVGGRVMCAENKKKIIKGKVADYDACSLYPSAMYRLGKDLGGFLQGTPKVIKPNDLNMNFLNKQDGYFIKIRINKVNKHLKFPLLNKKYDGVREFTNKVEGITMYVDKISLEDAIKFQNIEFDILQGYYFNQGRNNKITQVIKNLYDERVKLKQQKNPAQIVYKLLLNSVYGKTILKASDVKNEIVNENRFEKYINYHYNDLKNLVVLNGNKYLAQTKVSINDHFNKAQVGSEILAMSKRIMNEVITTAEDNNLNVYYQDTDSLHIDFEQVATLEQKYLEKYNKVLKGEDLGNFHIDFDLKGADGEIYATDSLFLGKKCYIDRLESVNKDGSVVSGYHIRMKGISTESINHYCSENHINPLELYKQLYDGDEITFDLTAGKTIFKYNNIGCVKTVSEFLRKIKF